MRGGLGVIEVAKRDGLAGRLRDARAGAIGVPSRCGSAIDRTSLELMTDGVDVATCRSVTTPIRRRWFAPVGRRRCSPSHRLRAMPPSA